MSAIRCRNIRDQSDFSYMHSIAAIERSKLSGLAQNIGDVGIASPERIIEPNHRHGFRFAQKGQTLGQLAKVDRTSQILQRWIIAVTGFAAGKFECPKKATLAILSAIGTAAPSGAPVEERFNHVQNDCGL